jgi:hypothetical protein
VGCLERTERLFGSTHPFFALRWSIAWSLKYQAGANTIRRLQRLVVWLGVWLRQNKVPRPRSSTHCGIACTERFVTWTHWVDSQEHILVHRTTVALRLPVTCSWPQLSGACESREHAVLSHTVPEMENNLVWPVVLDHRFCVDDSSTPTI